MSAASRQLGGLVVCNDAPYEEQNSGDGEGGAEGELYPAVRHGLAPRGHEVQRHVEAKCQREYEAVGGGDEGDAGSEVVHQNEGKRRSDAHVQITQCGKARGCAPRGFRAVARRAGAAAAPRYLRDCRAHAQALVPGDHAAQSTHRV